MKIFIKNIITIILFSILTCTIFFILQVQYIEQATQKEIVKSIKKDTTDNSQKASLLKEIALKETVTTKDNNNLLKNVVFDDTTKKVSATIIFGGDMMFDRHIRLMASKHGYDKILTGVDSILGKSDYVVANLEGPITENKSISLGSEVGSYDNFIFTFDPVIANTLQAHNIQLVNLGNNHIENFGVTGVQSSKKYLEKNNVNYFGDTGVINKKKYFIQKIKGIKFAFVNYNAFAGDAEIHIMQDIELVKTEVDFIIVYTHWGQEYKTHSNYREQKLAHQFIDAGADLIIGSHPHVIQEKEIYKGKTIYYSLGNFIFDQYFSKEVKKGLLVEATFNKIKDTITFLEHEIAMEKNGRTILKSSLGNKSSDKI